MNRILCAVAFLGVVLQCDYFLCCYADLDVREISWWPNKYLFLLQGTIEGKNKVQAKKKKLIIYLLKEFCFTYNLFLELWQQQIVKFVLKEALNTIVPKISLSGEPQEQ